MGKTRDFFKKIRDAKGTFHAKTGTIRNRNSVYLIEAEDLKKRWQDYIELYKKDLNNPKNHNGVITHLGSHILGCEVKWALGSITMNKASECGGIPAELFQILKDDAMKALHSVCQKIWKTQQWPQDWKRSHFTPIPKKGNAKECSNYHTIVLISQANERVTGRKARGLQTEEGGCKCQTFLSLLSGRRKQTSDIFSSLYKFKRRFLLKCCVAITPGLT